MCFYNVNNVLNSFFMKVVKLILLTILLAFLTSSCTKDAVDAPNANLNASEYFEQLNISYGSESDQKFDLYLPSNRSSSTKVIILIHGGGWSAGDKAEMNGIKDIVRKDFPKIAIVNINYRLADANNSPYPMQIDDITAIITHLKNNQDFYVMSDDIGFIGVSAGAHLSLLWSYAFDTYKNVKMVCSIVGPTNLADDAYINSESQELKDLILQFGTDIDGLKEVSPLYQVKANAPPTILFYGAQDPLIPISQGASLNAKLQELNVPHEYTLYPNGGHGWIGLDLLDTSIKLKAFIDTYY